MERRIGVHVSIAGGIDKGLERAKDLGCTTVQMFSHNPRGWRIGNRGEEEIARFRELKNALDISYTFFTITNGAKKSRQAVKPGM